ncbi:MAG: hypothetical protein ACFBWO_13490 [Paracoccaceae bacterium]
MARLVIALVFVGLVGAFGWLAWAGVWGESASVVSTRAGSPGGGYGIGRVK